MKTTDWSKLIKNVAVIATGIVAIAEILGGDKK